MSEIVFVNEEITFEAVMELLPSSPVVIELCKLDQGIAVIPQVKDIELTLDSEDRIDLANFGSNHPYINDRILMYTSRSGLFRTVFVPEDGVNPWEVSKETTGSVAITLPVNMEATYPVSSMLSELLLNSSLNMEYDGYGSVTNHLTRGVVDDQPEAVVVQTFFDLGAEECLICSREYIAELVREELVRGVDTRYPVGTQRGLEGRFFKEPDGLIRFLPEYGCAVNAYPYTDSLKAADCSRLFLQWVSTDPEWFVAVAEANAIDLYDAEAVKSFASALGVDVLIPPHLVSELNW